MSDTEPFITRASAAGLPADFCHNKALGDETLRGFNAHELAKVYWTLESLTISYDFTIEGQRTERTLYLTSPLHPIDRIGGGALFAQQAELPDRDQLAYLDLRDPREAQDGSYSLDFEVLEIDYLPSFMLCLGNQTQYPELHRVHTYTFQLFGKPLTAQLYARSPHKAATIESFHVHPEWFTFRNT